VASQADELVAESAKRSESGTVEQPPEVEGGAVQGGAEDTSGKMERHPVACTYDIKLDSIVLCRTFSFAMCQPPIWNRSGQQLPIEACHYRHSCVMPSMPRPPICAGELRLSGRPNGCAASRACQKASDARCSMRSTTRTPNAPTNWPTGRPHDRRCIP